MPSPSVDEGLADFHVLSANKPCKTWYRVYGSLQAGKTPLVALHGGPGTCHNYMINLADLTSKYGIPVILYDQIGNGLSTHLREKNGDTSFWTEQLFLDELDNLLKCLGVQENYHVLGHSWGGMLGSRHASKRPPGLRRLVLANSPAAMPLWVEAQNKLLLKLPQEVQDVLKKCEAEGRTDSKEYEDTVMVFMKRHGFRLDPWPEELLASLDWLMKKDPTVYLTLNGPSEFFVTGSLKDWSIVDEAHKIAVPVLLLNGRYDEAQDSVMEPFFREIPKVKWRTFENSSHMPHFEERESFMKVVGEFLTVEEHGTP